MQVKANRQNLDDLKGKGMTVNTVDMKEFADKTKDAWKQFQPGISQELVDYVKSNQ